MVDADVPLDGVVVLAVPLTRRFIERQIVAEGQLLQAAIPVFDYDGVNIPMK